MAIYYIVLGVFLVAPITAGTVIVLYALRKNCDVSASFWSKRFGFTLNAKDRPVTLPAQSQERYASDTATCTTAPCATSRCTPDMPAQSSAALPPREEARRPLTLPSTSST